MKFDRWILKDYERFSINYFSWMGSAFAKFIAAEMSKYEPIIKSAKIKAE